MKRVALFLLLVSALPAWAAQGAATTIYSCEANGKKITSDRYIQDCADREQRVLNGDGSLRQILPPTMTVEERAAKDALEKIAREREAREREAKRRDLNLLQRFPNEDAHRNKRELALGDVRKSIKASEARLALLAKERKPLDDETEFYVGKPLPPLLRQQIDANDAAADALKTLMQGQQEELVRVTALYDAELQRLKKLWAGAPVGSMGTLPPEAADGAPARPRR
jgi:hypothetical protein